MIRIIPLSLCFYILSLADLGVDKPTEPSDLILIHIVSTLRNARQPISGNVQAACDVRLVLSGGTPAV